MENGCAAMHHLLQYVDAINISPNSRGENEQALSVVFLQTFLCILCPSKKKEKNVLVSKCSAFSFFSRRSKAVSNKFLVLPSFEFPNFPVACFRLPGEGGNFFALINFPRLFCVSPTSSGYLLLRETLVFVNPKSFARQTSFNLFQSCFSLVF